MPTKFTITENEGASVRLDVFLTTHYPEVSRAKIQKAIKAGEVTVNGRTATPHYALRDGDVVEMATAPQPDAPPVMTPQADDRLDVVYEDDDVAVINKPSGWLVHPTVRGERGTLAHALLARWPKIATVGEAPERPGLVHRLDQDASGLMVVAKNQKSFATLKRQFQKHAVKKTYQVLVHGHPPHLTGTIDLAIGRAAQGGRMAARPKPLPGDRQAVTHYQVKESFADASLLEVAIETGRTHQIRAHLKALGNSVAGDPLYRAGRLAKKLSPRLFLHATRLEFNHPRSRKKLAFDSPLPADLQAVLEKLRRRRVNE